MSFLFVDRIVQLSPGELIRGVKHITRDDPYLTSDDQGIPCFVPSLIGETLGQLAAWNVMHYNEFTQRPVAGVVSSAQLHRPAYVGDTLLLESYIDVLDDKAVQYHSVARIVDEPVFTIEGALGPLLPMADFIEDELIRQQFAEIYRPTDWTVYSNACSALKSIKPLSIKELNVTPMTFDRIIESVPGVSMIAEKRITRSARYFADHFPKKPVLPMTVLLECKLNLAREFIRDAGFSTSYKVSELRKIKMNEFVQPGDILTCHVKLKHQTSDEVVLSYRSEVNDKRVCVVEVVLIPKGK